MANIGDYRKDFDILNSGDYVYFDNAATSQRPNQVLDAISNFYRTANANPLRGLYDWSMAATEMYEDSRRVVADFIGANSPEEIIFTRNTSESLNLVAYSYGLDNVSEGDEVVISVMEHHSNILPWQMVCRKKNAKLIFLEPNEEGVIVYHLSVAADDMGRVIGKRGKIANSIKSLIQAKAYNDGIKNVKVNIDSF